MGFATRLGERLSQIKVFGIRYNSPWTQVFVLGMVCFASVGMSSGIGGLGAGGTQDIIMADISSSILYAFFALTGLIAGSISNILGVRLTLCIGTMGYSIYNGSLWAFNVHGDRMKPFVYVSGALLGFSAALLWSAQGAIMMSYPEQKDKGRAFSLFWSIFSLGAVTGAAIALGIQVHANLPTVSTTVYLVFVIIMVLALFISWLILPANYVVRGDGTLVETQTEVSPMVEMKAWWSFMKDWRLVLLFPMFFTSNFFYAYQSSIVTYQFNARTRALNSFVTNVGQVVGANIIGFLLDKLPGGRKRRLITCWAIVLVLELAVWAGGVAWQVQFKRTKDSHEYLAWDWGEGKAPQVLVLMASYYLCDAMFQGLAYNIMSFITDDPFMLARLTGFYKGVQSAGAAVSFGMDAVSTPYLTELIVSWVMIIVSLPLALIVILKTDEPEENGVHVEDLSEGELHHAALPEGHHTKDTKEGDIVVKTASKSSA